MMAKICFKESMGYRPATTIPIRPATSAIRSTMATAAARFFMDRTSNPGYGVENTDSSAHVSGNLDLCSGETEESVSEAGHHFRKAKDNHQDCNDGHAAWVALVHRLIHSKTIGYIAIQVNEQAIVSTDHKSRFTQVPD